MNLREVRGNSITLHLRFLEGHSKMFYAKTDATLVKLLTAAMFTDGVISQNCTLLLRGSQFAIYVAYPKTEVTVVVRGQYTTVESGHSCLS